MSLVVDKITKKFAGLTAVDALSFQARSGEICALIGPNGAGKTTLLSIVSGLLRPSSGTVSFTAGHNTFEIQNFPAHRVASHGISRTYQNLQMFEDMSVLEVVMTGGHRLASAGLASTMLRLPRARSDERLLEGAARQMLHNVQISEDLLGRDAVSLPYGLQRRVEIARALVSKPRLLLLDEPAAGLNHSETAELCGLISSLRRDGMTVLLVEHDMDLVMSLSDQVVVMNFGRLIAAGTPREVQSNPAVIEAYLGVED